MPELRERKFGSSRAWRSEGRYFCREGWRGFENTVAGLSDVRLRIQPVTRGCREGWLVMLWDK